MSKYEFDKISFGIKLRSIRENYGYTQLRLAEEIGVSDRVIRKWEKGTILPEIDKVCAIAEVFNMTIAELLTDEQFRLRIKREHSRKRTLETLEIPGTIEAFVEITEDTTADRFEAWIYDEESRYKKQILTLAKMVSYEDFRNFAIQEAVSFIEDYRKEVLNYFEDDEDGLFHKTQMLKKQECEKMGMASEGAIFLLDRVLYRDIEDDEEI